jgi:hypothetical protein
MAARIVIGRKTHVGHFIAAWTVPIAIVVVPVTFFCVARRGVAINLAGLIIDCLGAITLGVGILARDAARVRNEESSPEYTPIMGRWQRVWGAVPVLLARKFGTEASSTITENLIDAFWGLVLLSIGFLAQAAAVVLQ